MLKKIIKIVKQKRKWFSELFLLHWKALVHGRDLTLVQNNLKEIKKQDILLFAVMKNEAHRLSFFINYYRKLGVNHFIFVDNGSTDHFNEIVKDQNDITTFYTEASYKESNFGMYWANSLLLKYGQGHWCMTCDPDEFLVYPYMENRDLRDLTDYLSSIRESSFFTLMVDMYGEKAVEECYYKEGTDPLEVCPYFDATGYSKKYNPNYRSLYIQGGVRKRVFYADNPDKAPALNKVCLVNWKWNYSYISSMHMAIPRKLNEAVAKNKTSGAVLHYKFIAQLTDKVKEEEVAQQHYDNSSEYKMYGNAIEAKTVLYESTVSKQYEDWRTLASLGLINKGDW